MSIKHRVRQTLAAGLLAASALLPAQAAIVVGSFDPPFGPTFPNLGFRGTLTVRVPDACFLLTPTLISNSDPCSGGQMQVLGASVELYNTSTPGLPTLTTLNFNPSSYSVTSALTYFDTATLTNQLRGINSTGNQLLSVVLSDPGATSSPTDDLNFNGFMSLSFFAQTFSAAAPAGATMFACDQPFFLGESLLCTTAGTSQAATTLFDPRVDEVPEPATLGLALAALGVMAGLRGRRRA